MSEVKSSPLPVYEESGQETTTPQDNSVTACKMDDDKFQKIFDSNELIFFPPDNIAQPSDDSFSRNFLEDKDFDLFPENNMNAQIQQKLKSGLKGLNITRDKDPAKGNKVVEMQINNLLPSCYEDCVTSDEETKRFQTFRKLIRANGLPTSLQCLPDIAVWEKTLLVCEGKNNSNYTIKNAIQQCSNYMLIHLYFLLVYKYAPVEYIYGIAFAGSRCRRFTQEKYEIYLLRLELPEFIGNQLVIHKQKVLDLKLIHHFVNHVCSIELNESILKPLPPAALQIPRAMLLDDKFPKDGLEIKLNGTGNLVFCVKAHNGWQFIQNHLKLDKQWSITDDDISEIGFPFYLKSKNHLACSQPSDVSFLLQTFYHNIKDIKDAYKISPFIHSSGTIWCVKDMGTTFRDCVQQNIFDQTFFETEFLQKFLSFMTRVLKEQDSSGIIHGDIHTGNFVYGNDKNFHLIDYDEARVNDITRRDVITQENMYVYNSNFVENGERESFTKQQLIHLFFRCCEISKYEYDELINTQTKDGFYSYFKKDSRSKERDEYPSTENVDETFEELLKFLEKKAG